jgi:multiple sugar transport system ATP-binding protein
VRPENIGLAASADGTAQRVPAQVQLLEPLGSETLVTLRIGRTDMIARCPAAFRQPPGTPVDVFVQPQHLHLFDAATGAAI